LEEGYLFENKLKRKLSAGKTTLGVWVSIPSPDVSEILSLMGFDWLVFDTEHSPMDVSTAQVLIQAMKGEETTPIIRVAWNDPVMIKRALDVGAHGVVVPWVNSREDAINAVRACKYPPKGIRGCGPRRAERYGLDKEYLSRADAETMVIVQIEHIDAVHHIDEILGTPGVDAFFIGPADLSASMGYLGQRTHPKVLETIEKILDAGRRAKVPSGIFSFSLDHVPKLVEQGFQFIAVGGDTSLLMRGAREALSMAKKG
jgi:2-keto-3-deoxy-L-rhamnonate aldolase RhmA